MTLDRRHFIAGIAGSAALAGCATSPSGSGAPSVAGLQAAPMPAFIGQSTQKLMPKGKAPRVVICGGGWGGLTTAANLRKLAPQGKAPCIAAGSGKERIRLFLRKTGR